MAKQTTNDALAAKFAAHMKGNMPDHVKMQKAHKMVAMMKKPSSNR